MTLIPLVICFVLSFVPALGGNPIGLSSEGFPIRWDAAAPVVYRPDQGGYGKLDNATIREWVQEAAAVWTDAPAVGILVTEGEVLGADVTLANYDQHEFGVRNGYTEILFDENGEIFEALGLPNGVVASAGIEFANGVSGYAVEGRMLLNGRPFDGVLDNTTGNTELSEDQIRSAIVHEWGHLLGLGHSDLNGSAAFSANKTIPGYGEVGMQDVETMFAILTPYGRTPHADDLSMLSWLYPDAARTDFGSITGAIRDIQGGLAGVAVTARDTADPFANAASTVSGSGTFRPLSGEARGDYLLPNLISGTGYEVRVTSVRTGSFSQAVRTNSLGVAFTPVLGLFYGPEDSYSGVESELEEPGNFRPVQLEPGVEAQTIDIVLNNIEELLGMGEPVVPSPGGNHRLETALPISFPSRTEAIANQAIEGEVLARDSDPDGKDDIEDFYRIVLPDRPLRVVIAVEPVEGGFSSDLDLVLFNVAGQTVVRESATQAPFEVIRWPIPGEYLIGVSNFDADSVEQETPYRLSVLEARPPRSGLTTKRLVEAVTSRRELFPAERSAADRNQDSLIDSADIVLQSVSPAPIQK